MTTRLKTADVMKTFRILLAACIGTHGRDGKLIITRPELEAAGSGELRVSDRPDGAIVLEIKKTSRMIRPH